MSDSKKCEYFVIHQGGNDLLSFAKFNRITNWSLIWILLAFRPRQGFIKIILGGLALKMVGTNRFNKTGFLRGPERHACCPSSASCGPCAGPGWPAAGPGAAAAPSGRGRTGSHGTPSWRRPCWWWLHTSGRRLSGGGMAGRGIVMTVFTHRLFWDLPPDSNIFMGCSLTS